LKKDGSVPPCPACSENSLSTFFSVLLSARRAFARGQHGAKTVTYDEDLYVPASGMVSHTAAVVIRQREGKTAASKRRPFHPVIPIALKTADEPKKPSRSEKGLGEHSDLFFKVMGTERLRETGLSASQFEHLSRTELERAIIDQSNKTIGVLLENEAQVKIQQPRTHLSGRCLRPVPRYGRALPGRI